MPRWPVLQPCHLRQSTSHTFSTSQPQSVYRSEGRRSARSKLLIHTRSMEMECPYHLLHPPAHILAYVFVMITSAQKRSSDGVLQFRTCSWKYLTMNLLSVLAVCHSRSTVLGIFMRRNQTCFEHHLTCKDTPGNSGACAATNAY
jgi:hypothetical protein